MIVASLVFIGTLPRAFFAVLGVLALWEKPARVSGASMPPASITYVRIYQHINVLAVANPGMANDPVIPPVGVTTPMISVRCTDAHAHRPHLSAASRPLLLTA